MGGFRERFLLMIASNANYSLIADYESNKYYKLALVGRKRQVGVGGEHVR